MEVATIAGLILGVVGIVTSMAMTTAQGSEARIASNQVSAYLNEMHAQILSRFDRLDSLSQEIRSSMEPNRSDV
jgi:hypothetical protein